MGKLNTREESDEDTYFLSTYYVPRTFSGLLITCLLFLPQYVIWEDREAS